MPLYINTNISSLNAQRQLMKSGQELDQSMERLSSGMRINSASDDAAGLAISNRQTSQIRGLNQAVRNANDGISLIQTAEGALQESTNILQRMRELAIQSANGIYGDADRATLDAEVQQLVEELDRIATTTSFNGQNILDGTLGEVDLQIGAQSNQTIGFEIQAVDADTLGMGSLSADVVTAELGLLHTSGTINTGDDFTGQEILINGQTLGAVATTDTLQDLLDNVNDNINGVTASSVVQLDMTSAGTGVVGSAGTNITVVGNDGNDIVINVADTESLEEFAEKVGENSGGKLSAVVNDDGKLSITAQDASYVLVSDASTIGGTTTQFAQLILSSDNGDEITIERGATGTQDDLNNLGLRETQEGGVIESVGLVASSGGANEALAVGDLTINGVEIDNDDTDSLQGKIDAINDVSDQTGVTAKAYSTLTIDMSSFLDSAVATHDQLVINGVDVDLALTNDATTSEDIVTKLNTFTDDTGVSARLSGTRIILESDQGAINIESESSIGFLGTGTGVQDLTRAFISTQGTFVESTDTISSGGTTQYTSLAGLKLVSDNGNPINVELGDNSTAAELGARLGLLESNQLGEGSFGSAISSISIGTAAQAQKAIDVIDNALETVNDIRSDLGAANNRLDFTISNLSNVSENTSAARARITDADFAAETAALSRAQVLQQASQAMLAQANARPQQVLSLLQ